MIRLLPLGINGFFPSYGRQTMSFLLLTDAGPLLLDAGTGISRLGQPPIRKLLRPYDKLRILLSHYHVDHIAGLPYLAGLWPRGSIQIFAPAAPWVDAEPESALARILSPPIFGLRYSSFPAPIEVIPLRDAEFQIGGMKIRMWRQIHPGGSVGFRIDDEIAYATDTAPNPAAASAVEGVGLLLHELWMKDAAPENSDAAAHSHFAAVAELAKTAGVGSLMLVHHPPSRGNAEIRRLTEEMARATGIPALLPKEGKLFDLSPARVR
jgi:ribonuclease BN (tRNA processing enzyme)